MSPPTRPTPPGEPAAQPVLPGMVRARVRRGRARPPEAEPEVADPVARVLVDLPLAHLDREFDYRIPAALDPDTRPGVRVRVRFAGRDATGFVLSRQADSEQPHRLSPLRAVVSPEPVLSPRIADLAGRVAERYAGTRADVLRLAIPGRHARAERQPTPPAEPAHPDLAAARRAWAGHEPGAAFLGHLADGGCPRAVWNAAPGTDWPRLLAYAAAAAYASGRGALLCVPDARDVDAVDAAVTEVLGRAQHVVLRADRGPEARYRAFLAVSRGARRVVVGTRSAVFAPVSGLGLVAVWDDGNDLYAEPRAPYPHAREVALMRARLEGTGLLLGGHARTVEAERLVTTGWAHPVEPSRDLVRERVTVQVAGRAGARDPHAASARLPHAALAAMRSALADGPVLVQNPRAGYAPGLACAACRQPARCPACAGPLRLADAGSPPRCGWCAVPAPGWACSECGGRALRAPVVGGERTAEELGRMFPGVPVRSSGGDRVLPRVPSSPALVVSTPGAEPAAEGGYTAVVLLDTWWPLARTGLRSGEEALRRWLNAGALARPGGRVVAVGDSGHPALQALVRWDPAGFARRELSERAATRLPPAWRLATITGSAGAVDDALSLLAAPAGADVLGPTPVEGPAVLRVVLRVPREQGTALSRALGELQRLRAVRKLDPVRVQVDPWDLE